MDQNKIRCEYCGSANIIRENGCAVIRRVSPETDDPIGKESLFFFFGCLSCGEQLYQEDLEGYMKTPRAKARGFSLVA
jgi:hypothetical protein